MIPQISKHTPPVFKNHTVQYAIVFTVFIGAVFSALYFYNQTKLTNMQLGKLKGDHEAEKALAINKQKAQNSSGL